MYEINLAYLIMVAYARAVGLNRDEASVLWHSLTTHDLPTSVDQAWQQLDQATQNIRRNRQVEDW